MAIDINKIRRDRDAAREAAARKKTGVPDIGGGDDRDQPTAPATPADRQGPPAAEAPPERQIITPSGRDIAAEADAKRAATQAAAIAAKERSESARVERQVAAAAELAQREKVAAQEAAIAAKERSESARVEKETAAARETAVREAAAAKAARPDRITAEDARTTRAESEQREAQEQQDKRTQAANDFRAVVDISAAGGPSRAERDEAHRISAKITAGDKLTAPEVQFISAAYEAAGTRDTIRDAEARGIPPGVAMAVVGTAPFSVLPSLSSRQRGILIALSAAGALAVTVKELQNNKGFNPPQGADVKTTGIDQPKTPAAVTFSPPQGAEVKTTGIDQPKTPAAGTFAAPRVEVAGVGLSHGLGGAVKELEKGGMDPAAAIAEAERIIREAQRGHAQAAASLKDARALGASPSATPAQREKAAREAQALEQELDQLDDARERAQAARTHIQAQASADKVASQGTAGSDKTTPKTTPVPGATDQETDKANAGAGQAAGQANTPKAGTDRQPRGTGIWEPGRDSGRSPARQAATTGAAGIGTVTVPTTTAETTAVTTPAPVTTATQARTTTAVGTDAPAATTTAARVADADKTATAVAATPAAIAAPAAARAAKLPVPPPIVLLALGSDTDSNRTGGRFPRRVQWRQGIDYKQLDLVTGNRTRSRIPEPGGIRPGKTPAATLKVIKRSHLRPKIRMFPLGKVSAEVTPQEIKFTKLPDNRFGGEKSPGFRS